MNLNKDISEVSLPQKTQDDTLRSNTSLQDQASRATSANEASQAPSSRHRDLNVDEDPLTFSLDQLNLHKEPLMAERMFLSLGSIIQHAAEELELDIDVQDIQDALRRADQIARNGSRDIDALSKIQVVLSELLVLDSNHLVEAATVLANASRDGKLFLTVYSSQLIVAESWRLPFGQSGLLALFLRVQATIGVEDRLLIPSLKFIGNTCADTDINREVAISPAYIPSLVRHVADPRISRTIVPVIYNICSGYGTCFQYIS